MENATILEYMGKKPKIHPSCFLCEGVRIIGDVEIGADSSVWFNTVIRGDAHYIRIGERTNIQDMSMLHVTRDYFPTTIGDDVTIGHSVSLHGATLKNGCMIGIGAVVLDGATIGERAVVAAGAVVKEGFEVPPATLAAGVPAKIIRDLNEEDLRKYAEPSINYLKYVENYRIFNGAKQKI